MNCNYDGNSLQQTCDLIKEIQKISKQKKLSRQAFSDEVSITDTP